MPSFTLSRRHALVAVACLLAVVLLAARLFGASPSGSTPVVTTPIATGIAVTVPGSRSLVVDIEGAVHRPGVYRLATGARIADAIARAGGTTRRADHSLVNLAAPLADGQQVLIARKGQSGAGGGGGPPTPAGPVDLNTATVEQLDSLPGVGPVT